jgi:hypothetical protein
MAESHWVSWFNKNDNIVQGIAAIVTALVALSALVGVKVQIDASAKIQQEQSARDIYREFLNLSISKPQFADPDYCAIKGTPQEAAYENYVDYLLYTSEQMLSVSPDWEGTLSEHLAAHEQYVCSVANWSNYLDTVATMIARVRTRVCTTPATSCNQ